MHICTHWMSTHVCIKQTNANHLYLFMWVCVCLCSRRPEEGVGFPGAGAAGSYEPSDIGTGTKFRFSGRAAYTLRSRGIPPAPIFILDLVKCDDLSTFVYTILLPCCFYSCSFQETPNHLRNFIWLQRSGYKHTLEFCCVYEPMTVTPRRAWAVVWLQFMKATLELLLF